MWRRHASCVPDVTLRQCSVLLHFALDGHPRDAGVSAQGVVDGGSQLIWSKTDAGRIEMQSRGLVKERAQRNLLLVIDGIKSEEMLLANVAGITPQDFATLQSLGLIEPVVATGSRSGAAAHRTSGALSAPTAPAPLAAAEPAATLEAVPLDYAQFTAALTQIISKELGLRGFVLTLAVEKAGTNEALHAVAQRTLAQVAERKGEAAAAAARRALYGR
jgi:hypothetical protein